MGFSMFSAQPSPIAIDFGSSSVKLLQIGPGEQFALLAAARLPIPDSIRSDKDKQLQFFEQQLPRLLAKARFKGRRAVCSVPSSQTFIQHMQIAGADGANRDDLIRAQLQAQLALPSHGMVIRSVEVADVHRDGQALTEVICFAIAREAVMRYVELLKKCKLELVGVHTEVMAMVRAFDHLHCREKDASLTTLYVDLGWGGTKAAIVGGDQILFARCIQVGGQQLDQRIAKKLHCDPAGARAHRLSGQVSMEASSPASQPAEGASAPASAVLATASEGAATQQQADETSAPAGVAVDRRVSAAPAELRSAAAPSDTATVMDLELSETADAVADELSMCLRYHQSLFRDRPIDRMIFLGGEARDVRLCQRIAKALRLPAQLGDPLARLHREGSPRTPGLALDQSQPGWAVACGLCTAPTDM